MLENKQTEVAEAGPARMEGRDGDSDGASPLEGESFPDGSREIADGALESGEVAAMERQQEVGSQGLLPHESSDAQSESRDTPSEDRAEAQSSAEGLLPQESAESDPEPDESFGSENREIANEALETGEASEMREQLERDDLRTGEDG